VAVEVHGTAFLHTRSLQKAKKLVTRLEAAFEEEHEVQKLDVHHGADFYELRFTLPFTAT
jgi:hypothetical protein